MRGLKNFYSILIISATCLKEINVVFFGTVLRNVVKSMLSKIQPIPQTNTIPFVQNCFANSEIIIAYFKYF